MKINISPNFVIPGYFGKTFIEIPQERITLRMVLEELTKISKDKATLERAIEQALKNGFISLAQYIERLSNVPDYLKEYNLYGY